MYGYFGYWSSLVLIISMYTYIDMVKFNYSICCLKNAFEETNLGKIQSSFNQYWSSLISLHTHNSYITLPVIVLLTLFPGIKKGFQQLVLCIKACMYQLIEWIWVPALYQVLVTHCTHGTWLCFHVDEAIAFYLEMRYLSQNISILHIIVYLVSNFF